jgi:hypothetical protein
MRSAWVVLGSSGQWSDWSQWVVCVCADEQTAKDRVGALSSAIRTHYAKRPPALDPEDLRPARRTEESEAWSAALEAIDSEATEYEEPTYRATEAPFYPATYRIPDCDDPDNRDLDTIVEIEP